jgi:hypothetical protein
VKVSDAACPFCGAGVAGLRTVPGTNRRLTRAAAFAFSTTVGAAAGVACGGSVGSDVDAGPADVGSMDSMYGLPGDAYPDRGGVDAADGAPLDGSLVDSSADGGPTDAADARETPPAPPYGAPAYGLPPPDAG